MLKNGEFLTLDFAKIISTFATNFLHRSVERKVGVFPQIQPFSGFSTVSTPSTVITINYTLYN
jgi:hypothetical protein